MRIKHKPTPGRRPLTVRGRDRRQFGRRAPQLPPPDPATRVEIELPKPAEAGGPHTRQRGAFGPIVVAGLAGVVVAVASKLVDVIHLPSSSEMSVAAFGLALIGLGLFQQYGRRVEHAPVAGVAAEAVPELMLDAVPEPTAVVAPVVPVDLPSLTGEIAGLLAQLRTQYGVAYRTTTWLDSVLPTVGFVTAHPELARDLLAVGALDAGGVRADVTVLTEAHPTDAIVEAGSSLLVALAGVRDACEQRDLGIGELPQSDPSTWPSAMHEHTDDDVAGSGTGAGTPR